MAASRHGRAWAIQELSWSGRRRPTCTVGHRAVGGHHHGGGQGRRRRSAPRSVRSGSRASGVVDPRLAGRGRGRWRRRRPCRSPRNVTWSPSRWWIRCKAGISVRHGTQVADQKFTTRGLPRRPASEAGVPSKRVKVASGRRWPTSWVGVAGAWRRRPEPLAVARRPATRAAGGQHHDGHDDGQRSAPRIAAGRGRRGGSRLARSASIGGQGVHRGAGGRYDGTAGPVRGHRRCGDGGDGGLRPAAGAARCGCRRVVHVALVVALQPALVAHLDAGRGQAVGQGGQVVDQQRRVGLAGRPEVRPRRPGAAWSGATRTSTRPARPGAAAWAPGSARAARRRRPRPRASPPGGMASCTWSIPVMPIVTRLRLASDKFKTSSPGGRSGRSGGGDWPHPIDRPAGGMAAGDRRDGGVAPRPRGRTGRRGDRPARLTRCGAGPGARGAPGWGSAGS